jgi:hypothetical protein
MTKFKFFDVVIRARSFKVLKFLNKKSIKKGNKNRKIQNIRIIPIFTTQQLLLRKSAAIILLLILLFNIIGYRVWFYYAEQKADMVMESRLDKDQYDVNELISITVPLDNPYQLEQRNFQRIDGEINFQGKNFKYVKRKVSDGNLILLCIPDARKMVLKKGKAEYGNAANDINGNSKGSSRSGTQKSFSGNDYISETFQLSTSILPYFHTSILNGFVNSKLASAQVPAPGKPPQTAMA